MSSFYDQGGKNLIMNGQNKKKGDDFDYARE